MESEEVKVQSSKFKVQRRGILVFLFFVFLFVFGFENTGEYGRAWDEQTEIAILLSNAKEYARLPVFRSLPADPALDSEEIPLISESKERDHGIAAYYGYLPVYRQLRNSLSAISFSWHVYTWMIWFLGVVFFYLLLKEVYLSPIVPAAGTLMFYFSPRFFAEGHYNNKDIVFLVFLILTLYFAVRFMKTLRWRDVVLFAVSSGFLMNGKILGIAVWGLIGLSMIVHAVIRKNTDPRSAAGKLLAAALLSVLCYVLLTPAMWKDPVFFLRYSLENAASFSRWDLPVLFRGVVTFPAHGISYTYLPLWMLMTTPVYVMLLFLASCVTFPVVLIRKGRKFFERDREYFVTLFLLIFLLPFLHIVVHAHTTVLYNGWRHCYFLYVPLCLCALYLPDVLLQKRREKSTPGSRRALILAAVLVTAGFAVTVAEMLRDRSFEYVYMNPVARRVWDPADFEGDYWNLSVRPALRHFAGQNPDEGAEPPKMALMELAAFGSQGWTMQELEAEGLYQFVPPEEAEYFLFNVSTLPGREILEDYEMIFSETHYDNVLSAIFIRNGEKQSEE